MSSKDFGNLRRSKAAGSLSALAVLFLMSAPGANAQITFTNSTPILIPGSGTIGPASLYPSQISVSGLTGTITDITVTLTGYSHTFTDDVGALLVGPAREDTLLFDGAGSGAASNLTLAFNDGASAPLPDRGMFGSGTYKPGQNQYSDSFFSPAPVGPYGSDFSQLIGTNPNGNYELFIQDFVTEDTGSLSSWSVTLYGVSASAPEPNGGPYITFAGILSIIFLAYQSYLARLRSKQLQN